ncbi:MAG: hypothetical protein AB7G37_13290, partial [Solirubrobacteraceae bacterium]
VTSSCPEVAPPAWHLYVVYAVPVPALSPFDEEAEVAATMRELHDQLDGFDRARVLRTRVIGGNWPAARCVVGREMPRETPIPNLFNVGDGVRDYGDGGMQACAVTGTAVADALLRDLDPPRSPVEERRAPRQTGAARREGTPLEPRANPVA